MAGADGGPKDVDPNLALFAAWSRDEEKRERDERRAAKALRDQERKAQDLVRAKDGAAADLKRVRQSPRSTAEEKAAADAAYRQALAAVVAAETGEAPAWAPGEPAPAEEALSSDVVASDADVSDVGVSDVDGHEADGDPSQGREPPDGS